MSHALPYGVTALAADVLSLPHPAAPHRKRVIRAVTLTDLRTG